MQCCCVNSCLRQSERSETSNSLASEYFPRRLFSDRICSTFLHYEFSIFSAKSETPTSTFGRRVFSKEPFLWQNSQTWNKLEASPPLWHAKLNSKTIIYIKPNSLHFFPTLNNFQTYSKTCVAHWAMLIAGWSRLPSVPFWENLHSQAGLDG